MCTVEQNSGAADVVQRSTAADLYERTMDFEQVAMWSSQGAELRPDAIQALSGGVFGTAAQLHDDTVALVASNCLPIKRL